MRGRLGAVAAKVIDTASRGAKNGSPARDPAQGKGRGCRWCALVLGPFSGVDDHAAKRSKYSATPRAFAEASVVRLLSVLSAPARGEQMQDQGINVWAEIRDQEQSAGEGGQRPVMQARQTGEELTWSPQPPNFPPGWYRLGAGAYGQWCEWRGQSSGDAPSHAFTMAICRADGSSAEEARLVADLAMREPIMIWIA